MPETLRITVLGSGTSSGVPTIGCSCATCASTDPRDNRLRPSVLIQYGGKNVLIDTTPDFRAQALRTGIGRVDAILFTHAHADHILGLDDVRPLNYHQKMSIPAYGTEATLDIVRRVFRYAFDTEPSQSSAPRVDLHAITEEPFDLFGLRVIPIPLMHGRGATLGFRFGDAAYLTDHSDIPEGSKALLRNLDVLFLDALRHRPHPTHSTVEQSLASVCELAPQRAFFTHICHDLPHAQTEAAFPPNVRLAYDGLQLEVSLSQLEVPVWMRVARSLEEAAGFEPVAVTIGNFDGVHTGHHELLREVARAAREKGLQPAVLTFDPHPASIVAPQRAARLLTTQAERCAVLAREGIEYVLVLPFTRDVANWTPEQFVERVLVQGLRARAVIVGDNFRFGHGQAGDVNVLARLGERYGFETRVVTPVKWRGRAVSSSEIRRAVESGKVDLAARLLGRPYATAGEVVPGHGIGSKQTVPTLNLRTRAQVLPSTGVYLTRTLDLGSERSWNSITNVGYRPTFADASGDQELTIETFLLDHLDPPSPLRIRVEFLRRVRDERKFETPEALKAQILRDVRRAQAFFRRVTKWMRRPLE